MAKFFIDTSSGRVATQRQLIDAGMVEGVEQLPPRPWLRIQGTDDATTMWFSVMRRQEKGIHIGSLVFRQSDHRSSLEDGGWREVPIEEIGAGLGSAP